MTLKAILDANIYISYLLTREAWTATSILQAVELGFAGAYTPLISAELFEELERVTQRPNLAVRFPSGAFVRLRGALEAVGVAIKIPPVIPSILADPNDDYLLAMAAAGEADYLVSGDKHLLAARKAIELPKIVTASEFVHELVSG